MHIKTMIFDYDYHKVIIEEDTTAAFIGEMRAIIFPRDSKKSDVLVLEVNIRTHSYYPELIQQWIEVRPDEAGHLESMIPFQVMVQAKSDGSIKITHLRDMAGLLGWCELLDELPS